MLRAVVLAIALALVPAAQASRDAAPPAPPEGYAMQPVGQGTLTWFGLRVYDAALWAPQQEVDFSRPFALVIRYARDLDGDVIAERSLEEIARLDVGTPAQRRAWAERLRAAIPDVAAGDEIAGVYQPGRGARFYLNGRRLGEIDDPAFGRAFFSIWLDPRTSEPELRAALIGGR